MPVDHKKWMNNIPDIARFCNICLPGSHDAGLYEVTGGSASFAPERALTQDRNIFGQLEAGVRFFDLRVYEEYSLGSNRTSELKIGHFGELGAKFGVSSQGHADLGCYGPPLLTVLSDVSRFISAQSTEAVILRFSHIKESIARQVVQRVNNVLGRLLFSGSATGKNLAKLKLERVRGKVIAIYGADAFGSLRGNGTYLFKKAKLAAGFDMPMCGDFSDAASYGAMNDKQHENLINHYSKHRDWGEHLIQLYWTLTGGNIETNTLANAHGNSAEMVGVIQAFKPNIVLYDFCNEQMSEQIIKAGNPVPKVDW